MFLFCSIFDAAITLAPPDDPSRDTPEACPAETRETDDDFLERQVGELVARICKALDVTVDWSLWEDETWAIEEAAARRFHRP